MKLVIPVAGFGGFVRFSPRGLSFFVFFLSFCFFFLVFFELQSKKQQRHSVIQVIQSSIHHFIIHQSLFDDSASRLKIPKM